MSETVQIEKTEAEVAIQKAKGFWAKYSKLIIIVGSAVILFFGGYTIYKYFYLLPKEKEASEMIFPAEKLFDKMAGDGSFTKDSVGIVLNGGNLDGNKIDGLLKVISKYSGTPSGNRAQYIVGACYLQLKDFDKAITYLKEFDGNGANQVQSKAYLLLGHAYAEKKNTDQALSYYKKAASVAEKDESTASVALFTAGMYAEAVAKNKEAIDIFQELKDKYPLSSPVTSGDADKYLARLGVTK